MKKKIGIFFFVYLPVAGRNGKKKCILMFLGFFPIACVRKKNVYMYFWVIFQQFKRKQIMLKKCRNGFGTLPKLYCDRKLCIVT